MPRPKAAATVPRLDPLAEIRQLRARQAALRDDLRAKRDRLLAEVGEIDEALAEMGGAPPAPLRAVAAPASCEAVTKAETPRARVQRVPRAEAAAADATVAELNELMPWIGILKGERRQAVEMRAKGIGTASIAAKLGIDNKAAQNRLFQGRRQLREARTGGTKPTETPASDDEPAPAPAAPVNDNAEPASIEVEKAEEPRAPTGWNRSDPDEDFADIAPAVTQADQLLAILQQPEAAPADGDDLGAAPMLERVRAKLSVLDGRVRARTISAPRLSRAERQAGDELDYPADVERPRTRGDCQDMPRPCPFVSCSHHLYLDVNPDSGAIKLNFPHLEVDQMAASCSLDVADRGGITLEEVGAILNLTRERIRQVEVRGLEKIRAHEDDFEDAGDRRGSPLGEAMTTG
jgi:DNA-directed RNA polymerase specialized sigma24 family protein